VDRPGSLRPGRGRPGQIVVEVTRGGVVESVHSVAACAVDPSGAVAFACGDVDEPVFLRSSAKPFIGAAIVESGAAERYGFGARELAVICASHNGEPFHVEAVRGILRTIGLDESALQCGTHPPSYEPAATALLAQGLAPSAIHNNCSGKHAGILAMCTHLGFNPATYLEAEHPVQRRILTFCARLSDDDPNRWTVGIDGCGIPVYATPLLKAALAFARFATLEGVTDSDARALQTVREAMAAEPTYVGGTGRFDTALIVATKGRIVCKGGAEAVHGDALLRERLGLVLKIRDGSRRATPPAATALLGALGALEPGELEALAPFASPDVRNVAGRVVGRIVARV
jgi:L-asparaginase II